MKIITIRDNTNTNTNSLPGAWHSTRKKWLRICYLLLQYLYLVEPQFVTILGTLIPLGIR